METFLRVLQQFGEKFGIPGLQPDAHGLCTLRFDEKIVVQIQHATEPERLVLFARVGEVPAGARVAAYEMLLRANLFWTGTDGATLSVEPQGGSVFLAKALPAEGLSADALEKQVQSLVDNAEFWMEELARLAPGAAAPAAAATLAAAPPAPDLRV